MIDKKRVYFVYSHTRKDMNSVFYIGIGSTNNKRYDRANDIRLSKRNMIWGNIFNSCGQQISINILYEYNEPQLAFKKEIELIKKYGKLIDKKGGILSNLSDGGEFRNSPKRRVIQYDLNGKPIKIWSDGYLAADFFGITYKSINNAINKKNASVNYQWRWFNDETRDLSYIGKYTAWRKINQFDLTGNFIKSHNNMADASKETEIDRGSINNCILGTRISAGGFIWSYDNSVNPPLGYIIIQYDFKMNKIAEYAYVMDIVRALGLTSSMAIRNCFSGKQKQAYGFFWRKELKNN